MKTWEKKKSSVLLRIPEFSLKASREISRHQTIWIMWRLYSTIVGGLASCQAMFLDTITPEMTPSNSALTKILNCTECLFGSENNTYLVNFKMQNAISGALLVSNTGYFRSKLL